MRADVASEVLRHILFGALSSGLRLARDPSTKGLNAEEIGEHVAAILVEGLRPR